MRPTISMTILLPLLLSIGACWDLKPGVRPESDQGTDTALITDKPWYDTDEVSEDPCHAVVCNSPPPDYCDAAAGENVVVRYDRNGYCEVSGSGEPTCSYLTYRDTCLLGACDDGEEGAPICPDTPLQARYCLEQLPSTCRGPDELGTVYPHGVLNDDGTCEYPERTFECDCDEENNICLGDPCAERVCNAPPARYCHDDRLVLWEPIGRCTNTGECWYIKRIVTCSKCEDGACADKHPCDNRHCTAPPANFCSDRETLYVYDPHGSCDANGACVYKGSPIACDQGCENGHCTEDECKGVSCIYPPSPSCVTNSKIRVLLDVWTETCEDGLCNYETESLSCLDEDGIADGCLHGACASDECAGMLTYCAGNNYEIRPPAPYCDEDGNRVTYTISDDTLSIGENVKCAGLGHCEFPVSKSECIGACEIGQCVDSDNAFNPTDK